MELQHEYVLVHGAELEALKRRADRFDRLEALVRHLISKEEQMAAAESAEAQALNEAIAGLQAELADVGAVDAEVVVDLEGVAAAVGKVNPVTVEQVNAVAAATSSLQSLTAKLKAAGQAAGAVENPPAEQPPAEGAPQS